jgi:hypothetical protein
LTIGPRRTAQFTSLRAFQGGCRESCEPYSAPRGKPRHGRFRGHSKAEHKERIAELIAADEATPQSLFICIMQFGKRE